MKKFNLLLVVFCTILLSNCKNKGCTSPNSYNYNPEAEKDDGSCEYFEQIGTGNPDISILSDPTFEISHKGKYTYNTELDTFSLLRNVVRVGGTNIYGHGFSFHSKISTDPRLSFMFWNYGTLNGHWPMVTAGYCPPGDYSYANSEVSPYTFQILYKSHASGKVYTTRTKSQSYKLRVVESKNINYFGKEAVKIHIIFDALLFSTNNSNDSIFINDGEIVGIIQGQ